LLAFNTRLKPGVNEKSPPTLRVRVPESHRIVARPENQTHLSSWENC
jgi:hypothetical protein